MNKEQIKNKLNRNSNLLYQDIANDVYGKSAVDKDPEKIKNKIDEWINFQWESFQEHICKNETIGKILSEEDTTARKIELVVVLGDILSTYLVGIAPWNISILLVRLGIDNLCKTEK